MNKIKKFLSPLIWLKNTVKETYMVASSKQFDYMWYKNKHSGNIIKKLFYKYYFAFHYIVKGSKLGLNPSKIFYTNEYLIINPDVALNGINPLVHYEKYGKYEGRAVALADIKEYKASENTISIAKEIHNRNEYSKKIVTVLAMFSSSCKIEEYQLYLLKGLKEISDYIIVVADNTIYEEELKKLEGLCNAYRFIRHGEYDFGSYKYGYNYLIENNILKEDDNLLFINDSNYGPVYPFKNVLDDFKSKECDFYGLSCGRDNEIIYIQSFFYIFKSVVYLSETFKTLVRNIKKELSAGNVILNYEYKFTDILSKAGFIYDTYVKNSDFLPHIKQTVPTKFGYTLITKYNYVFLKRKYIQGAFAENPKKTLEYLKNINPELYNIITTNPLERKKVKTYKQFNIDEIHKRYKTKEQELIGKKEINIVFLVNMASMFAAESLMNEMKQNKKYNVSLYIIPDVRFTREESYRIYEETYKELKEKYDFAEKAVIIDYEKDEVIEYKNVIKQADIVCYPSPYDVSYSLYNPYYAVQENILSIHINYGFFRSIYDRFIYALDNYNSFWKVFLETEYNMAEYKQYGRCNGINAVLTGYAKMDRLSEYMATKKENKRKRIIIAPHHSVDGGMNKMLALSNFEKYADLFLELPLKYPEIDFIFRPHPVLFSTLKNNNKWGEAKVENYINKLKSYKNVIYSTEGDYLEIFANSDGIIQDSGSFLVEYFYTGNPCCYMLKTKKDIKEKFNTLGIKCLENVYIAYEKQDILDFIDNVIINKNDKLKEKRNNIMKEIMVGYPEVNKKIIEII